MPVSTREEVGRPDALLHQLTESMADVRISVSQERKERVAAMNALDTTSHGKHKAAAQQLTQLGTKVNSLELVVSRLQAAVSTHAYGGSDAVTGEVLAMRQEMHALQQRVADMEQRGGGGGGGPLSAPRTPSGGGGAGGAGLDQFLQQSRGFMDDVEQQLRHLKDGAKHDKLRAEQQIAALSDAIERGLAEAQDAPAFLLEELRRVFGCEASGSPATVVAQKAREVCDAVGEAVAGQVERAMGAMRQEVTTALAARNEDLLLSIGGDITGMTGRVRAAEEELQRVDGRLHGVDEALGLAGHRWQQDVGAVDARVRALEEEGAAAAGRLHVLEEELRVTEERCSAADASLESHTEALRAMEATLERAHAAVTDITSAVNTEQQATDDVVGQLREHEARLAAVDAAAAAAAAEAEASRAELQASVERLLQEEVAAHVERFGEGEQELAERMNSLDGKLERELTEVSAKLGQTSELVCSVERRFTEGSRVLEEGLRSIGDAVQSQEKDSTDRYKTVDSFLTQLDDSLRQVEQQQQYLSQISVPASVHHSSRLPHPGNRAGSAGSTHHRDDVPAGSPRASDSTLRHYADRRFNELNARVQEVEESSRRLVEGRVETCLGRVHECEENTRQKMQFFERSQEHLSEQLGALQSEGLSTSGKLSRLVDEKLSAVQQQQQAHSDRCAELQRAMDASESRQKLENAERTADTERLRASVEHQEQLSKTRTADFERLQKQSAVDSARLTAMRAVVDEAAQSVQNVTARIEELGGRVTASNQQVDAAVRDARSSAQDADELRRSVEAVEAALRTTKDAASVEQARRTAHTSSKFTEVDAAQQELRAELAELEANMKRLVGNVEKQVSGARESLEKRVDLLSADESGQKQAEIVTKLANNSMAKALEVEQALSIMLSDMQVLKDQANRAGDAQALEAFKAEVSRRLDAEEATASGVGDALRDLEARLQQNTTDVQTTLEERLDDIESVLESGATKQVEVVAAIDDLESTVLEISRETKEMDVKLEDLENVLVDQSTDQSQGITLLTTVNSELAARIDEIEEVVADLPTQWNQRVVEAEAKCDAGLQAVSASVHEVEDVVINSNRQHAAEQMKSGKETQLQADAELALRKRVQEVQAQCAQALAEAQQAWKAHADAAGGRLETLQLAEESCELRVAACEDALLAHSREVDRLAADADALAVRMGSPGTPTRPRLMEQMVQLVNNRAASPLRPPPPMSTVLQPTATAASAAAAPSSSASPQSPGSPGRKSLKERIGERLASTQGSPRAGSPLARLTGHEASLAQGATQASPRPAPLLMAVSAFSASLSPPGRAPVSPLGNPAQRLDTATQMSPLLQQPGSPRPGSPATAGLAATAGATPMRSPRPRISDRIAAAVQEMQSRSAGTTPVGSPTTTAARPPPPRSPLGSTAGSTGSPRVPLSERIHAIQTQAGSPQLKPTRTEPAPAMPASTAVPSSEYGGMKLSERLAAEQGTDPLSPQVPVSPLLPHHAFSPAAAGILHGSDLAERVAALEGAEAERKKADCDLQDSLAKLEEVVRLVAGGAGGHPEVQGIIDKVYHLDEDVRYLRDAVGVADGGVGGDGDIRNLKRRLDFLEEQQLDMRQGIHRLGSSGVGGGGGGGVGGGAPRSVKRLREGSVARSVGGRAGSGGAIVDVGRLYSGGGQSSPVLEAIHASVNRLRDMSPLRQRAEPAGVTSAAAAAAAGAQSLYGVSTPASSIAVATAAAAAAADYRAAMTVNATSAAAAAAAATAAALPLSTPSSVARTPYADSLLTSQYYAPPTVQPSASRYSTAAASVLPAYSPPPVHDVTEGLFD